MPNYNSNIFSDTDIKNCDKLGIQGYVTTPNGSLKKYTIIGGGTIETIDCNMPSDPNDPETYPKENKDEIDNSAPVIFNPE